MKHLFYALFFFFILSISSPLKAEEIYEEYPGYNEQELLGESPQEEAFPGEAAEKNPEDFFTEEELLELDRQWAQDKKTLPAYASLDLDEMRQYPEYPTGCEPISLTIALNHYGFNLTKEVIPEEYLIYASSDMIDGFLGDPSTETGAGIFPPALVDTANDFLTDKGSDLVAYNTSDKSFGELLALTAKDIPVLLWVTYDYKAPVSSDMESVDEEGLTYHWYWNEHCVVINAFDLDENLVYLSDPNYGYYAIDLDELRLLCASIGNYSMAIS